MITKICTGPCKRTLPENQFHWRSKAKRIRIARCKCCAGLWAKAHYLTNREMYIKKADKWNKQTRPENLKKLVSYLLQHPCIDCGEDDVIVLTFDHVRGKKRCDVSCLITGSWNSVEKEIKKCEVRCANCHMRRTSKQFKGEKLAIIAHGSASILVRGSA